MLLTTQTATVAWSSRNQFQDTKESKRTEVNETTLSHLSGESPETLQFFAELHRSQQFTEAALFRHFGEMKRRE